MTTMHSFSCRLFPTGTSTILRLLPLLLFLLSYFPQPTESFSSWFIETTYCHYDLRDTEEEIIMNNYIVPTRYSKRDHSEIHIQVFENSSSTSPVEVVEVEEPVVVVEDDLEDDEEEEEVITMVKRFVVYIDYPGDIDDLNNKGNDDLVEFEYLLKLHVDKDPVLEDLQYAMDAKIYPEEEDDEDDDEYDDDGIDVEVEFDFEDDDNISTSEIRVEFTRRSGCYSNLRAHGKRGDDGVTMKIQVPSSIFRHIAVNDSFCSNDGDGDDHQKQKQQIQQLQQQHRVDVVAGWARNHEAVTLTNSIEFRPRVKAIDTCSSSNI